MLQRINLNHLAILFDIVMRKFTYDIYPVISKFKLLSSVVVVDIWFGEVGEILGRRWAILLGDLSHL